MGITLYDISVESYKQTLGAVSRTLDVGLEFMNESGTDPDTVLTARLAEDMLPLTFQLHSVRHHSLGAISGIMNGEFSPPPPLQDMTYSDYQSQIAQTLDEVSSIDPDTLNDYHGKTVVFKLGENQIPFTAENFVLSFSLPNLYFHATTTYDLLRQAGAPLGKRDYMGRMRIQR